MRNLFILSASILVLIGTYSLTVSEESDMKTQVNNELQVSGISPTWEVPLAAGVWYPQSGPLQETQMRYYRVRCWPGCHSGSSLGMYEKQPLEDDEPIFHTSTIDNLVPVHSSNKTSTIKE
jgi:hypothetical protein